MKIVDLVSQIWKAGGALRGGRIVVLASKPRRWNTADGTRFLLFPVDDNDLSEAGGEKYFNALGLVTKQTASELRTVVREAGILSIAVDHIAAQVVTAFDNEDGTLRLVYGRVRSIPDSEIDQPIRIGGTGMVKGVMNALLTASFDAEGRPVHLHSICLDADGAPVTREEKQRRIAAVDAEIEADGAHPSEWATDGTRRSMTLIRLTQ
jgi:hypothetical protein